MISTLVCNGQNKQNQEAKEALTDKPDREPSATYRTLHDFTVKDIDGNEFNLATLKGKKVLVVNVASRCGLTPQYEELQKLYSIYQDKGFTLIGFPANNFNGQEPGTNEEIKEFCTGNYGVTFPMMAKISVKGEDMAPLYRWLTQKAENGVMDQEVTWNFQKFMIDEEGRLVDVVMPRESPLSDKIVEWIRQD
ncbi:MAG: Glutathione peroxidase, partial [Proteiniphilum sp. 51_7]